MKEFISEQALSERKACLLVGISRSQYRYKSQKREDPKLIRMILDIKEKHPCYGSPRVLAVLRRRGMTVNGKRVCRLLKTLNLSVPRRKKRKLLFIPPSQRTPQPLRVGCVWSMDFVFDRLVDGTPFRCFTIIDNLSRQVPGIFVSKSMAGFLPIDFLESLKERMKLPKHFILDNGSEFANEPFVAWCTRNNISLHFIDPGKPVQNAYVESFNGKFRKEFLDSQKFTSLQQLKIKLENWVRYYNEERPHSSLDYMTPKEFADQEQSVLNTQNNLLVLKTG